jgi:hypothetical protein
LVVRVWAKVTMFASGNKVALSAALGENEKAAEV